MPSVSSSKRAFTLFELLIVIILISIIYGVFVHKLTRKPTIEDAQLSLKTLKKELQKLPFRKKAEFICVEPCDKCYIYLDEKIVKQDPIALFKESPKVYYPDSFGQIRTVDFLPLELQENELSSVCFRYEIFSNGSSSHYVVEYKSKYYLFDPYMYDVNIKESLSDASSFFDVSKLLPTSTQDY
jgi:prepilin-type N-terminal cleavage/methylation domain-containing protein